MVVKPLAIRAAVLFALRKDLPPPVVVCVPCGSSHGPDYWPPPESMHSRVALTPFEREIAARIVIAVRTGAISRERIEIERTFPEFLERFAEVAP
jgi:hypothetical protein